MLQFNFYRWARVSTIYQTERPWRIYRRTPEKIEATLKKDRRCLHEPPLYPGTGFSQPMTERRTFLRPLRLLQQMPWIPNGHRHGVCFPWQIIGYRPDSWVHFKHAILSKYVSTRICRPVKLLPVLKSMNFLKKRLFSHFAHMSILAEYPPSRFKAHASIHAILIFQ